MDFCFVLSMLCLDRSCNASCSVVWLMLRFWVSTCLGGSWLLGISSRCTISFSTRWLVLLEIVLKWELFFCVDLI